MTRPPVHRPTVPAPGSVREIAAFLVARLLAAVAIPLGALITRGSRRRLQGHHDPAVRNARDVIDALDPRPRADGRG